MTNLTEKWIKGELINGKKYYITFYDSEPFEATFRTFEAIIPYWKFEANGKQYCDENGYDCVKVLAEVPSFEEWFNQGDYVAFLEEENTNLKKLLKECRDEIEYLRKHYKGSIDHLKNNTRLDKEINQVLGENK